MKYQLTGLNSRNKILYDVSHVHRIELERLWRSLLLKGKTSFTDIHYINNFWKSNNRYNNVRSTMTPSPFSRFKKWQNLYAHRFDILKYIYSHIAGTKPDYTCNYICTTYLIERQSPNKISTTQNTKTVKYSINRTINKVIFKIVLFLIQRAGYLSSKFALFKLGK